MTRLDQIKERLSKRNGEPCFPCDCHWEYTCNNHAYSNDNGSLDLNILLSVVDDVVEIVRDDPSEMTRFPNIKELLSDVDGEVVHASQ